MIQVFTTGSGPENAGDNLTGQFNEWYKHVGKVTIISAHTNSNKFGWMLTIHYKLETE